MDTRDLHYEILSLCVNFFFQAEDGIRDGHVTGVQTCALPIYSVMLWFLGSQVEWMDGRGRFIALFLVTSLVSNTLQHLVSEIGRAPCRERVKILAGHEERERKHEAQLGEPQRKQQQIEHNRQQ